MLGGESGGIDGGKTLYILEYKVCIGFYFLICLFLNHCITSISGEVEGHWSRYSATLTWTMPIESLLLGNVGKVIPEMEKQDLAIGWLEYVQ